MLIVAAVLGVLATLKCFVDQKATKLSLLWIILPAALSFALYQILPQSGPISSFPTASMGKLIVLASAITIFLSSVVLFRDATSISPIFFVAAISGFAIAFVGVIQNLGWNGKILWVYELLNGGVPFGPFVNRNNAAGYLILALSGPIYFFALQVFAWRKQAGDNLDSVHPENSWNPLRSIARFLAGLEARHLYCLTGIVAITTGVFLSLSRGGSLSVVAALSVAFGMMMMVNRWLLLVPAMIIACCVATAWWVEQTESVSSSLATIAEADQYNAPRLLHWNDALPYYTDHWQLGSGLGTYRYEYPVYQQQRFRGKFAHAESVYLETLAELGMPGITALLLTALLLLVASVRLFRRDDPQDKALGVAGCFAIVGLSASAALDFGIYQPANFILAAILFGCIIGRSTRIAGRNKAPTKPNTFAKAWRIAVLLLLIAACGYGSLPSAAIESSQLARRQMKLHVASRGVQSSRLEKAHDALLFAESKLKDDWETQFLLGQYHVYKHRLEIAEQVQNETEAALREQAKAEGISDEQLEEVLPTWGDYWTTTSLSNLHRLTRITQRQSQPGYKAMRQDPNVVTKHLQMAWDRFQAALKLCDREERIFFRLAQLTPLMGPEKDNFDAERQHMLDAMNLAKGYSGLEYDCGLLALNSGDFEMAAELWANCLAAGRRYEAPIIQLSGGFPAKTFFEKVLPQDPQTLLRISRNYLSSEDLQLPNKLLLVHTRRVIESSTLDVSEKFQLLGKACFQDGDFEKSREYFSKALESSPSKPPWRVDYAMSLKETGHYQQAIEELAKCQVENPAASARLARMIEQVKRLRLQQRKKQSNLR